MVRQPEKIGVSANQAPRGGPGGEGGEREGSV